VHAGALDVLHYARYQRLLTVADGVDFGLDALEVLVDQDGLPVCNLGGLRDITNKVSGILDNLHCTAAEDVARADEHWGADKLRGRERFFHGCHGSARGLRDAEILEKRLKAPSVLGDVDRLGAGAEDRVVSARQRPGEVDGCLAAKLHDGR
jgi:hypothetical protein